MPFWNKPREDSPSSDTATQDAADAVSEIELDFTTPIPLSQEPQPMAMLKRDEISSSPPAASDLNALLGRGSEFEGKLTFEGTVRIDGKFTGSIVTNDVLVVGEGAKISAEITCGTIIIHGEVNGNIRAKSAVELHHPAKMRGNIETPSLVIEKGVLFEGQSKMENLSKEKPAVTPPPISAVKS